MCRACDEDNPDWDCDDDDEDEMDEDDEWVEKDWNGRSGEIEIEKKWLERAIALIREHKITVVEEAYKIVEILEQETDSAPYDEDVANTVVVALRETKDEREIMARRLAQIREAPAGGAGLAFLQEKVRKGQRRRAMLAAVCMIPGCGCNGAPHP